MIARQTSRYRTRQGDVLDAICHRWYGSETMTAAVLAANPGLAAVGPLLPANRTLVLPASKTSAAVKDMARLW